MSIVGNILYAWQEQADEGWGNIAATIVLGEIGPTMSLLVTRQEFIARTMYGPIARAHAERTGNPVRLARFTLAEVLEEI